MNPYDAIRWINIVALGLVVIGLLISAWVYRRYPLNVKGVALGLFAASGLYSTVEALINNVPGGIRSVTVLFVALVAVILIYTPMVESWVTSVRRRKQFRGPDLD